LPSRPLPEEKLGNYTLKVIPNWFASKVFLSMGGTACCKASKPPKRELLSRQLPFYILKAKNSGNFYLRNWLWGSLVVFIRY